MVHQIYVLVMCCLLLQAGFGQDCSSAIKNLERTYQTSNKYSNVDSLIAKADHYATHPPHRDCIYTRRYYSVLSDLYFSVFFCHKSYSTKQALYALDKAAEYMLKAGEIDPRILMANGEGASALADIYRMKSRFFFDLKAQEQYDEAVRNERYWTDIYTDEKAKKQQFEERKTRELVYQSKPVVIQPVSTKQDSVVAQQPKRKVEYTPRTYDLKYVGVLTRMGDQFRFLKGDEVSFTIEPPAKVTRFWEAEHHQASVLFGEGVRYRITVNGPGIETQFYEMTPSYVSYDTIFIPVFPKGTRTYYTCCDTRAFEPDSFSIQLIYNHYGAHDKEDSFKLLVADLGLEKYAHSSFRKQSGAAFAYDGDTILAILRQQSKLIEYAGPHIGLKNSIAVLTNNIHIVWKNKPENQTTKEQEQITALLTKYELKPLYEEFYEAPPGLGLKINDIVDQLNRENLIHIAYPEIYRPILPKQE